jgi:hypothetical protein
MQEFTNVDYSIRLLGIKKSSLVFLEKELLEFNFTKMDYFKNPENFVFVIDIDDKFDLSKLKSCLKEVNECKIDLFVSIFSEVDSDIIDVPPLINKLIKDLKLSVTLSYTISVED